MTRTPPITASYPCDNRMEKMVMWECASVATTVIPGIQLLAVIQASTHLKGGATIPSLIPISQFLIPSPSQRGRLCGAWTRVHRDTCGGKSRVRRYTTTHAAPQAASNKTSRYKQLRATLAAAGAWARACLGYAHHKQPGAFAPYPRRHRCVSPLCTTPAPVVSR
jgi:hypothetical protein